MTRTLAYALLALFVVASVALVAARPQWVSDNNEFLRGFVTHEFLALLGVILVITLASVSNIHLEFNKIEERYRRRGLQKSRDNIKKASYWLIALFLSGVALVVVKPILAGGETAQAVANMGALFILFWQILILITITQLVFAIPPHISEDEGSPPQSPQGTEEKTP